MIRVRLVRVWIIHFVPVVMARVLLAAAAVWDVLIPTPSRVQRISNTRLLASLVTQPSTAYVASALLTASPAQSKEPLNATMELAAVVMSRSLELQTAQNAFRAAPPAPPIIPESVSAAESPTTYPIAAAVFHVLKLVSVAAQPLYAPLAPQAASSIHLGATRALDILAPLNRNQPVRIATLATAWFREFANLIRLAMALLLAQLVIKIII